MTNVAIDPTGDQYCGGRLDKPSGTFKTPNWPDRDYPAGVTCSWHIVAPKNQVKKNLGPEYMRSIFGEYLMKNSLRFRCRSSKSSLRSLTWSEITTAATTTSPFSTAARSTTPGGSGSTAETVPRRRSRVLFILSRFSSDPVVSS